jgi:hypothetical protein
LTSAVFAGTGWEFDFLSKKYEEEREFKDPTVPRKKVEGWGRVINQAQSCFGKPLVTIGFLCASTHIAWTMPRVL